MRIGKTPLQILHHPVICARRPHHIRVLHLPHAIPRSQHVGALAVAEGLRVQSAADGVDLVVVGVAVFTGIGAAGTRG